MADLVILLDLPLEHRAERDLALAAIQASRAAVATVPPGDGELEHFFSLHGGVVERIEPAGAGDLSCVQRFLFTREAPAPRPSDGSLEVFSAPGEGRESVEIARRILKEAAAGVPFDQMAIFVRAPQDYFGLLEHALRRAGIPAWFDRGTRRPHPAGRALLALLACAGERLSAARFAEYLSLGQVPSEGPRVGDAVPSRDEALDRTPIPHEGDDAIEARELAAESPTGDEAVIAGTLRAPWKWERFLVDAAVIGGGPDRWARRLDGLDRELQRRIERAVREEGIDDARVQGLERVRQQLANLRAFALPIVATLAGWPERATWGEWLDRLEALVPAVLRTPARVLQVLADLRPMAAVGPVDLDEVRRVLTPRLLALESEPPSRRFGRVLVGTPDQARGRLFRVVFVPGLAERMFPQKPREDPLLVDDVREAVSSELSTHTRRLAAERLRLQLAAGAATERLYVSYPRFELTEARARVPSFYVLDLMRAATGRIPDYERLEAGARERGSATLAWPAPPTPDSAIDDQEHDLAVLRRLLDHPDPAAVRGHAHYLLQLNDCLRRSVVARWSRGAPRWSPADGLIDASPAVAPALAAERLTARPYSVSALQQFSACPYQFLLSAIYRLQPFERPEPLQRLDPLSRGSLFHEMQARLLERLRGERALPVTPASLDRARIVLDEVVGEVAERAHDDLAPAVERVWNDEIASMRRDLHGWLERLAHEGAEWRPAHFELAFGDVPGRRDPASVPEPVLVGGRFRLRGAVDLVEEHRQTRALRVTDHKTGRCPDGIERALVGGGAVLQPVLYAMCVEAAFGRTVTHSRLWYCTSAGGYAVHEVALTDPARAAGIEVLEIIDRAIERGVLVAAPTEEACGRCDFLPVCGPGVFRRIARKPQALLADLHELRSRP